MQRLVAKQKARVQRLLNCKPQKPASAKSSAVPAPRDRNGSRARTERLLSCYPRKSSNA